MAPDVLAIRAWEQVRSDTTMSDYDKCVEISRIFREYVEAVLGFVATAWTTREILTIYKGFSICSPVMYQERNDCCGNRPNCLPMPMRLNCLMSLMLRCEDLWADEADDLG